VLAPPTGLTVTGQSCTPTYSGATNITYRAGTTANGTDTVVVPRPAGTVAGDLLIVGYSIRSQAATINDPTGWTRLRYDVGTNISTGVWYHVAASNDPASWTWTSSVSALNAVVAIAAYTGASGINVSGAQLGSAAGIVAPSITPTSASTRLVGVFTVHSKTALSTPTGMTERLEYFTPDINGGGNHQMSISLDDESWPPATATGTRTATGTANDNVGILLALTPAVLPPASTISYQTGTTAFSTASTTLTLTLPSGIIPGDLLLVGYGKRKTIATIGTPGGWTLQAPITQYTGAYQQGVYWRVATSIDTVGKTYDWVSTDTSNAALVLMVYRGVDQTAPVATMTGQPNTNTSVITAASVTPSKSDTRLVAIFGEQNNRTVSAGAAGMTTRQNIRTATPAGNAEEITIEAEDQLWPDANTATGDRVATMSGNGSGVGHLLALKAESYPLAALSWTATTSTYADGYRLGRVVGGTETVVQQLTPYTTTSYTVGNTNRLAAGVTYTMNLRTKATNWLSSTAASVGFTARSDC
jgi:hypothetical protein